MPSHRKVLVGLQKFTRPIANPVNAKMRHNESVHPARASSAPAARPVVSIVMATHNRAHLLQETITSLLGQTFQDFEIIVADDASNDGTPALLEVLKQKDPRIRTCRSEQNIGPGAARNLAVQQALGEFIAIMDDDDICMPHRLEQQVEVLRKHPEVALTFSPVAWFRDKQEVFHVFPSEAAEGGFPREPDAVFECLYLRGNRIPNVTLMGRSRLWICFPYPSEPWIGEDWFWLMQHAARGEQFLATTEPLVLQRRDLANSSLVQRGAAAIKARRQVLRAIREWLHAEGISKFDHLHRRATSERMTSEARCWRGFKGLIWAIGALLFNPSNAGAQQTIGELLRAGFGKLTQPMSLFRQ